MTRKATDARPVSSGLAAEQPKSIVSNLPRKPEAIPADPPARVEGSRAPLPTTVRKTVMTGFTLDAPNAHQVTLSGDFNQWSPTMTAMKRERDGNWSVTLPLPPGVYQYKFVVDGVWWHDPEAQYNVPNDQGTLNSVREVQASS